MREKTKLSTQVYGFVQCVLAKSEHYSLLTFSLYSSCPCVFFLRKGRADGNDNDEYHKGGKLANNGSDGEESCPKKYEKAEFDHVPFANAIGGKRHAVQRTSHVRVTIVAKEIVHSSTVDLVGLLNRFVPAFDAPCFFFSRETSICSCQRKGHFFVGVRCRRVVVLPGRSPASTLRARVGLPKAMRPWSPTEYGP